MLFRISKEKAQTIRLRDIVSAVLFALVAIPAILLLLGTILLYDSGPEPYIFGFIFLMCGGLLVIDIVVVPITILLLIFVVKSGWIGPFSAIILGFLLPQIVMLTFLLFEAPQGFSDLRSYISLMSSIVFLCYIGAFWAFVTWVTFYFMRRDLFRKDIP